MKFVDILVLLIIVFTVLRAYRKTLGKNARDWASLAFSIWFTLRTYGKLSVIIAKLPIISNILGFINKNILVKIADIDNEVVYNFSKLKAMNLSKEFNYFFEKSSIFRNKQDIPFTEFSMGLAVNVASIIIIFLVTVLVIRLLFSTFDNVNSFAGTTSIEKPAGMLFGFLKSLVYVMIIAIIVHSLSTYYNSGLLYDQYHKSIIVKTLYESNLLSFIFGV